MRPLIAMACGTMLALTACASVNRLGEYDFRDLTLSVHPEFPPYPEVLTGPYFPGHPGDPIHAIIRAGSRIAKEIKIREVRHKLDSAAALVDVPTEVSRRLGERAARHLGARLIEAGNAADVILEVEIRDYGIDAEEWEAAAHVFVDAEAWLLDGADRRPIWKARVRSRDPITPAILGPPVVRNAVTAAAFARLSVDEISRALTQLSYYAADRITDRLRSALEDARSGRP